jgi:hypothetical protein
MDSQQKKRSDEKNRKRTLTIEILDTDNEFEERYLSNPDLYHNKSEERYL